MRSRAPGASTEENSVQDQQTPLNSGFGFHSSAAEVLTGIDAFA
ncbi:hypothetical protein SAMN05216577_12952 [Pseudomonas citronellolis]|jgi:hypothetical protein|uniref:Uncharacterized protein n=1 Tax=Pseudomonas citronellolis TaxID=53408 RepID=A0AAQ1KJP3_9PSED|nr:hypothetical protein [Pseudomonas citronellolis]MCP1656293.1 hypothetical protein [Pseudomonas citronellolis]MCP1723166.1 hypothetical protein [Pseudomonas citronellolis]SFD57054.1 hypothetical protein SAMN05216577_12952 [Pseudomonas citronellolis]